MSWNTTPQDMGLPGNTSEASDAWAGWKPTSSRTSPPTPKEGVAYRPHSTEDDERWPPALPPRTPVQREQDRRRAERASLAHLEESHRQPLQEGYQQRAGAATGGQNTPSRRPIPAALQRIMETGGFATPMEAARSIQTSVCPTPTGAGPSQQVDPTLLQQALLNVRTDPEDDQRPTDMMPQGPDPALLPPTPISHSAGHSGRATPMTSSQGSGSAFEVIPPRPTRAPPGPPPGGRSGYDTPVSETGYVMRTDHQPLRPPSQRNASETLLASPLPASSAGEQDPQEAQDQSVAQAQPVAQAQAQPAAEQEATVQAQARPADQVVPVSWRERNPPTPRLCPVPGRDVVARMATGQEVIHGEAWSHEDPNQYVTRRYWARTANIYSMLDTFGGAGIKGILDQLITLDDGYTNKIRNLEPLTRDHVRQAPFYYLVPGALEHLVTVADNVAAVPAHPLTARLPQESLRDDPTGRWAHFQTSSTDPQDLTTWAAYNAMGQAPHGIQGWLLCQDKPRDEAGNVIHYDHTQGVYHPRLVRDIGHQPKHTQLLCRTFTKSGRCNQNSNCPLQHVPQSGMFCRKFMQGDRCTQLWQAQRCDHIHGIGMNDPTGTETYGTEGRLAFTPDTTPDLLTSSTSPPDITDEHRARVAYPVWVPVPSPSAYHRHSNNMDSHMYGTARSRARYAPPVMPEVVPRLQNAIQHLMETINSENTLPSEVALELLNQHVRVLIDDLPDLADHYDENRTRLTGRRALAHDIRPTNAVDLRNRLTNIRGFLRDRLRHVRGELTEAVQNLVDRPGWDQR